jgi:C4-dicarboxylate-specific signal transduction histidine kinase
MSDRLSQRLLDSRWPWLAASLALTLGLFVSTTLGWLWYADQRDAEQRRAALDVLWLEQTLQRTLETNAGILANWAQDLAAPGPSSAADFRSRSAELMKNQRALIALEYLDAQGHRVTGQPDYAGERPAQLPPVNDPLTSSALTRARALARPAYSAVIEQSAPLWVLVVPVLDDAGFHGSVLATYDLDRLLELQVPWWFVQRYDLALVDRDHKRLSPSDGPRPEAMLDVHKLSFGPPDSGLALWASPHAKGQASTLLAWLALAAVLLALLIIWLLRILQRWLRERRAAQLALSAEREALARSHEQLYAVLAGLGASVSVSALDDGRLLFRNRQHEQTFPMAAEGDCCLLRRPMLPPPDRGPVDTLDAATGRWFRTEQRSIRWVDGASVLLEIATDITSEREAAHTARERDELLQHTARLASLAEFASGIAHELNQPLAAIANYAAVADSHLSRQQTPLPTVQDAVARMGDEAHRAGRIIQSLRSFIQKRAVEHRAHRVDDLLREPLALLQPLAQRLQVAVQVHNGADEARIDCDGVMIEQVLFNLLRNALEAVAVRPSPPPHDAVSIELADDGEAVAICVADRGTGIAEPARLFQAFYTTKPGGMGLGLAICRTVVESHGGRLWAEDNPGGGARLHVRLPRSTLPEEACMP